MPRLRKQSYDQRKKAIHDAVNKGREKNRTNKPVRKTVEYFRQEKMEGPNFTCVVCRRIRFSKSLFKINKDIMHLIQRTFVEKRVVGNEMSICWTCRDYINKDKIPPMSEVLQLNEVPAEVGSLNQLEIRLISPRIPFINIGYYAAGRQPRMKGSLINIPVEIPEMLYFLPRKLEELHFYLVYFIQLKRRIVDQKSFIRAQMDTEKTLKALIALKSKPLYAKIKINAEWKEYIDSISICTEEDDLNENNTPNEDEEEQLGANYTMIDDIFRFKEIEYAPGEKKNPLSVMRDDYAEEYAFPQLFGGQPRKIDASEAKKYYTSIVKFELLNEDSRFRNCVENIFYKYNVLNQRKILDAINISVRKRAGKITVKDVIDGNSINSKILDKNIAYRLLSSIPASPSYWI